MATTSGDSDDATTGDVPVPEPTTDGGTSGGSTGSSLADPIERDLDLWFTPLSLELGDLDGDGAIDLLVTGTDGTVVTAAVLLGGGDGTFADPIPAGLSGCSAYPVVGMLSDDARADALVAGCGEILDAFAGQPDGTLAPWSAWPTVGAAPVRSTVIADFESDGDADVMAMFVSQTGISTRVYVRLWRSNDGVGFWSSDSTPIGEIDESGFDPNRMVAGHFDGDGLVDLALTDQGHDVVRLRGVLPESFAVPLELGVEVSPWSTIATDLDGDGLDDLLVSSHDDLALQVLANAGDGEFSPQPAVELVDFAPYDTAVGDLDGDGSIDAAMVDATQSAVRWLVGDGQGGLGAPEQRALASAAIRVHAADVNGDDHDDLVLATFAADSITLLLSQSNE